MVLYAEVDGQKKEMIQNVLMSMFPFKPMHGLLPK